MLYLSVMMLVTLATAVCSTAQSYDEIEGDSVYEYTVIIIV